jgi:hypothetical protein
MSRNNCSVLLTLFDSKEDLISKEIIDFLELEDFRNLDSSICNHKRRKKLLDCFDGQSFEGSERVPLGDKFLLWACKRGVSIRKLLWKLESEDSTLFLLYLCQHQGWNLRKLIMAHGEYDAVFKYLIEDNLICLVENSPDLMEWDFQRLANISGILLWELKNKNPEIRIGY